MTVHSDSKVTDFGISRRDLLEGGGALIVGFSLNGAVCATA